MAFFMEPAPYWEPAEDVYMITQTVKADADGVFTCAASAPGWWGVAALNEADFTMTRNGEEKGRRSARSSGSISKNGDKIAGAILFMHISEGILSGPVLVSGAALAAVGTGIGLKSLDYERIARAGILSASFFVASLIHVPIGPSSIHLILNGVVGLLLGWGAVPAILVALLLQGALFQFGGVTTLGVNTVIMAAPAVAVYLLFGSLVQRPNAVGLSAAFMVGFCSVLLSGLLAAAALVMTGESFLEVAGLILAAHLPVMVIEGVVTLFCVAFFRKVQPTLLPP